jgi:hypothetical protein
MENKHEEMENERVVVEQELSHIMERTLQLENDLYCALNPAN